jgi:hypothetical protein
MMMIAPSNSLAPRRWVLAHVSLNNNYVRLPKCGWLWRIHNTFCEDGMVKSTERTYSRPALLQSANNDFFIDMRAGELWIEISDVELAKPSAIAVDRQGVAQYVF